MSGSNAYSPQRDLTHKGVSLSPGLPITLSFVRCSHKGGRAGALMKGRIPYLCAACVLKEKAK